MSKQGKFHPQVPVDIAEAISWYEDISDALGRRFRQSIRTSFQIAQAQPYAYAVLYDDIRLIRVTGFPYVVQYKIVDEQTFILGVFHSSSNPEKWKKRAREDR